MRLRGTYHLSLNGQTLTAHNAITTAGLALAGRALIGQASLAPTRIGLMLDGQISPDDTAASHPGWEAAAPEVGVSLSADGAALKSGVATFTVLSDGFIGGAYLMAGDVLFSTAPFEVFAAVQGDTVQVDYTLDLESA